MVKMIEQFNKIKSEYDKRLIKRELLVNEYEQLKESKITLEKLVKDSNAAAYVIRLIAKQTQQNLEFHVSNIVTSALRAIDPGDWPEEFVMRFEIRGRAGGEQTECDMFFKEAGEEYAPELGSGGGPLDVASFALRIAYWSLKKNRSTFLLDEPFKYVSPDLQNRTSKMVKMMCDMLGIQIILISHALDIEDYSDKEINVSRIGGRSVVKIGEEK